MQTRFEAIVIGGGPAGATAALLLAQAGWSVALLEAKRFPRRKVCGECLAASNLPLLEALGVGEAVLRLAGPELRRVAIWRGRDSIAAALPSRRDAERPWGRAIGREHLDRLLIEEARRAGAVVLQPCRARSIRGVPGNLSCEVDVGRGNASLLLRAALVIGAHGSWQAPPAGVGDWPRPCAPTDLLAFKASFRDARLPAGVLPVLSFAGGYGGIVAAGENVATLACCIRRDSLARCRLDAEGAPAGEAVERYLRRECHQVNQALREASRIGPWLAAGPIRPAVRLTRADTHAFLIGNAAGEAHPIIGEGISMALQSAWLLCRALAQSPDVLRSDGRAELRQRALRERYSACWRAHFSTRLRLAACFAHAAMRPGLSGLLAPLLRRAPALLTLGAGLSGKTRCAVSPEEVAALGAAGRLRGARLASGALTRAISGNHP